MSIAPATILRVLALAGPVAFTALFLVRALNPFDPLLATIGAAMVLVTGLLLVGRRLGGWLFLIFPVAVLTSPAIGELSFSLSAIDSAAWRWHAIASLISLGVATVAALTVASRGTGSADAGSVSASTSTSVSSPASGSLRAWASALAGGLALGLGLLLATPALADHPGFGRELTEAQLVALPTVDLLNYRYEPGVLTVPAHGVQRFRLVNPSDLPHTVTIDAIDVEVSVPAGRWAVLEFDAGRLSSSVAFYCSIGDHRDLGMSGLLEIDR